MQCCSSCFELKVFDTVDGLRNKLSGQLRHWIGMRSQLAPYLHQKMTFSTGLFLYSFPQGVRMWADLGYIQSEYSAGSIALSKAFSQTHLLYPGWPLWHTDKEKTLPRLLVSTDILPSLLSPPLLLFVSLRGGRWINQITTEGIRKAANVSLIQNNIAVT